MKENQPQPPKQPPKMTRDELRSYIIRMRVYAIMLGPENTTTFVYKQEDKRQLGMQYKEISFDEYHQLYCTTFADLE